jgi:hypothetical protein
MAGLGVRAAPFSGHSRPIGCRTNGPLAHVVLVRSIARHLNLFFPDFLEVRETGASTRHGMPSRAHGIAQSR